MASEITLTLWTDGPADPGLAHRLAVEAAASVHRSTGLNSAAVAFDSRQVEPTDCVPGETEEVPAGLPVYGPHDAGIIIDQGVAKVKAPNPVYLVRVGHDFAVETNEGPLTAHAGDFLAHDPISGHVWPVAASYVEQHYIDPTPETPTAEPAPAPKKRAPRKPKS